MATLPANDVALKRTPSPPRGWMPAGEFVLGEPATRFELFRNEIVSFFDLLRVPRDEDSPPLALALVRLAAFVAVSVAITALMAVGLGAVAAKALTGFVG